METMREECLKAMDLQHQMLSSRRDDSPKKNHTIETQEKLMQTENYVFGKNSANLEIVWNEFKKDLDLLLNYDSLVSEIPKLSKSILVQVKQNMQQSDSIQRNESSQLFISQEKRLNREQEPLAEKLNPKLASVDKISNPEVITASNCTMT